MKNLQNFISKKIISIFIIYFALNLISWIGMSVIWGNLYEVLRILLNFLLEGGLPIILIFIYIVAVHNKKDNIVLLQVTFILFALCTFLMFIFGFYSMSLSFSLGLFGIFSWILYLLLLVGNVLNIISSFQGFENSFGKIKSKNILYLTFIITCIFRLNRLFIYLTVYGFTYPDIIFILIEVILFIATLMIYFSLFVFFKNNDFSKSINVIRDTTEGELNSLKEKLDLNLINEEEYQEKRKEVINKI